MNVGLSRLSFDVVLGNPPFSKANEGKTAGCKAVNLYPMFWKKSLEIADVVAMIMPRTDRKHSPAHNLSIIENANSVIKLDHSVFNVGVSVWCVFADKNDKNRVEDFRQSTIPKNDVQWVKGKMTTSKKYWESDQGRPVIHAIYISGPQIFNTDTSNPKGELPNNGYVVLFGQTANSIHILKSESQLQGSNVISVWFESKTEAEEFKIKLAKKFTQVDHLRTDRGALSLLSFRQIEF